MKLKLKKNRYKESMVNFPKICSRYKKQIITVCILISLVYVCTALLLTTKYERHKMPLDFPANQFYEMLKNQINKGEKLYKSEVCPTYFLKRKVAIKEDESIACQKHVPSKSGCLYAARTFVYDKKRRCDIKNKLEVCTFHGNNMKCSYSSCGAFFKGKVHFHIFNQTLGEVKPVIDVAYTDKQILRHVLYFAEHSIRNGYHFLFVSCGLEKKSTQLILVDEVVNTVQYEGLKQNNTHSKKKKFYKNQDSDQEKKININFLLVDSVSRPHFFRSLKETVASFDKINEHSQTEVLDFELFQSLHGHTAENLHALFTGTVYPKNVTNDFRKKNPIGIKEYYKHLKDHGYYTIYQEDLCIDGIWGLRAHLGNFNGWQELSEQIKDSYVDSTGLTMSNCRVLQLVDIKSPYNTGKDEMICYNGQQHDAYLLQKLLYEFKNRKNIFAFTYLSFSHDAYGLRTQSLDGDLSRFVKEMSKSENTLTVLMADHGNTYTKYVYLETEGRYEMFHPALFLIIPEGVKKALGTKALNSLRLNQKRLFTILDIRDALEGIIDSNKIKKGVLKELPKERNCKDLPLRMPNLCVCDGATMSLKNSTDYIGHLEYAVGQLNNIINRESHTHQCKFIVPQSFNNVLQQQDGDKTRTMFNIVTAPGYFSPNDNEQIYVEVSSVTNGAVETYQMKLNSYDRLSSFGVYRNCSDADKRFSMCVCDLKAKENKFEKTSLYNKHRTTKKYEIFSETMDIKENTVVIEEGKLLLNIRSYYQRQPKKKNTYPELYAVTFEAINVKNTQGYYVQVNLTKLNNMKLISDSKCDGNVQPDSVIYLCTLVRKVSVRNGVYSYNITYALT